MKIEWILCEFFEPDTSNIIHEILENTEHTTVLTYGNLLCKSANDLNIINKILTEKYFTIKKQKELEFNKLPNLFLEHIRQLIQSSDND